MPRKIAKKSKAVSNMEKKADETEALPAGPLEQAQEVVADTTLLTRGVVEVRVEA